MLFLPSTIRSRIPASQEASMTSVPTSVESKSRTHTASRGKRILRWLGFGLLGLLVVLVVAAVVFLIAWSRGLIQFPALTGPYPVGRAEYHLVDESRPEIFSAMPDDKRELMITIYYPASPPAEANPAPYTTGLIRAAFGTPDFFQDSVRAHAFVDVPLAAEDARYPVIVFSPGMGFLPIKYAPTLEDLASHGYVVVSLSHPYSTAVTVFPDGRVVTSTAEAGSRALSAATAKATSDAEFDPVVDRIGSVWVADVRFVLDQLEQFNVNDALFANRLDLTHVGVFGHSMGGGAAVQAMSEDDRFDAAIDMDGTLFGEVAANGIARPVMLMLSERVPLTAEQIKLSGSSPEANAYFQQREAAAQAAVYEHAAPGYRLTLQGSTHHTFIGFEPIAAPAILIPAEVVGTIDGKRAVGIIDDYVVSFFDQHLKGQISTLLDGSPTDYPEVVFESHNP
jgi:predicted dienelactone hydrolase